MLGPRDRFEGSDCCPENTEDAKKINVLHYTLLHPGEEDYGWHAASNCVSANRMGSGPICAKWKARKRVEGWGHMFRVLSSR